MSGHESSASSEEFSKTLRFDLPRVPIVGLVLLAILSLNRPEFRAFFLDEGGRFSAGAVAVATAGLGVVGIVAFQLLSLVGLRVRIPLDTRIVQWGGRIRSSNEWLAALEREAIPVERRPERSNGHRIDHRLGLKVITRQQRHATLHALEMECRRKSPAFGVQLEYYYSMFIVLFCAAGLSGAFAVMGWWEVFASCWSGPIATTLGDTAIFFVSIYGAVVARRMQEYLRVVLFNHDRLFALSLIGSWFHCRFGESAPDAGE
jgi:hypothetical protein